MEPPSSETVYTSASLLRTPRRFLSAAASDLRIVPVPAWQMFVRNTKAQYRQTWLRFGWLLLPPLALTLTWTLLSKSGIVHFGHTQTPYVVYVLSGTLFWQLFLDSLNAPLTQLVTARQVVTKTRLPHETWIIAGVFTALFALALRLVLLGGVLAYYGMPLDWTLLLVPVGLLTLVLLGLGIGLLLTPLGLLYQDVSNGIALVVGFWFFLTPVLYPPPTHGAAAVLVSLNPVTPLLTTTRDWLVGTPGGAPVGMAIVGMCSFALLTAAWIVYRLAQPHLVARL